PHGEGGASVGYIAAHWLALEAIGEDATGTCNAPVSMRGIAGVSGRVVAVGVATALFVDVAFVGAGAGAPVGGPYGVGSTGAMLESGFAKRSTTFRGVVSFKKDVMAVWWASVSRMETAVGENSPRIAGRCVFLVRATGPIGWLVWPSEATGCDVTFGCFAAPVLSSFLGWVSVVPLAWLTRGAMIRAGGDGVVVPVGCTSVAVAGRPTPGSGWLSWDSMILNMTSANLSRTFSDV
ncbi:hypothetical protein, variant 2, partial [Aphanomyces astaci]